MALKFNFMRVINIDGIEIMKPNIPIHLECKGYISDIEAKLDTGSDFSYFDKEIGDDLDIVMDYGEKIILTSSTGGEKIAYLHDVNIILKDGIEEEKIKCRVAFAEGVRENLIGRKDFFYAFRITLCEYENLIQFERVTPSEADADFYE